jgi:hypothetical protein
MKKAQPITAHAVMTWSHRKNTTNISLAMNMKPRQFRLFGADR